MRKNKNDLQTLFKNWDQKRQGWKIRDTNNYENQLDYFFKIKKNVPVIIEYYNGLTTEQKEKLNRNPILFYFWKAYKENIISFEKLQFLTEEYYKQPKGDYYKIQERILIDNSVVSKETMVEWKKINGTAKLYLDANKEYYSILLDDKKIANIIDLIVETLTVNASKSAFGANKIAINRNKLIKIFEMFELIYKNDLTGFEEKIKEIRQLSNIAKEVFSFYNLDKGEIIYNTREANFFKFFYDNNANNVSGIKDAVENLKEKYCEFFEDNLFVKKISELINDKKENLIFNQDQLKKIQIYLQLDQLIYDWDSNSKINYWIFQGNPNVFDFKTALKENLLNDWTVTAHKEKIKKGDKVIIWITGKISGCYAFAEVTHKPKIKEISDDDHLWKKEDKNETKAGIKITHNLFSNPITKEQIQKINKLSKLKVGNQGTNFSATEKEYKTLFNLVEPNNKGIEIMSENIIKSTDLLEKKKQIILYGPAGTGKTFSVKDIVKEFCNEDYEILKKEGRVKFLTFHQSYAYEEFIEGIKAETDEGKVSYFTKSGIFKELCKEATPVFQTNQEVGKMNEIENVNLFKLSLGNSQKDEDNPIYDYCINNNVIALGWGERLDFTKADSKKEIEKIIIDKYGEIGEPESPNSPYSVIAVNYFKNKIKKGDIILIPNGNKKLRAIGLVTGEYEFNKDTEIEYANFRKVEWLNINLDVNVKNINQSYFAKMTLYRLNNDNINFIELEKLLEQKKKVENIYSLTKNERKNVFNDSEPFFLIIDEINRGNISKIFGELITLLEKDKRLGEENEIVAELPYSNEPFGIPPNVYIIGTMNTSDKSIAQLDLALRRRFGFLEMLPEHELLSENIDGINLRKLLQKINQRIEVLLDKDHTIGHSYFMQVASIEDLEFVFYNEIIPLLEEYFYGDYEKLQLVIGKEFVECVKIDKSLFESNDVIDETDTTFKIKKENFEEAINNIVNGKPEEEN